MNDVLTVQDVLNFLAKLDTLTSDGARVVYIKQLLEKATKQETKRCAEVIENASKNFDDLPVTFAQMKEFLVAAIEKEEKV